MAFGIALICWSLWNATTWTPDDLRTTTSSSTSWCRAPASASCSSRSRSIAFATLDPALRTDGTSLLSLFRNVGSAIGVSVTSSLLAHNTQVVHAELGALRHSVQPRAAGRRRGDAACSIPPTVAAARRCSISMVNQQALIIAYIDDFKLMMLTTLPTVLLLLLMRRPNRRSRCPPTRTRRWTDRAKPMAQPPEDDVAAFKARLDGVRAKRGYLLPHHGLLALTSPELLAGYDAAYTAVALTDRVLSHHDREFVWLAVLAATDEALATHHIAKFREAGGTDEGISRAFAACAWAIGGQAHDFAARDWARQTLPWDPRAAYLDGVGRLSPIRLVHLAQSAVHVCRARWRLLEWQIEAAYTASVPEDEIAEALTLAMFPGSIPHFVEACGVWQKMIATGRVAASPRYRAWATMEGQGGFDEASGIRQT